MRITIFQGSILKSAQGRALPKKSSSLNLCNVPKGPKPRCEGLILHILKPQHCQAEVKDNLHQRPVIRHRCQAQLLMVSGPVVGLTRSQQTPNVNLLRLQKPEYEISTSNAVPKMDGTEAMIATGGSLLKLRI